MDAGESGWPARIKKIFRDIPIRLKLMLIICAAIGFALLVAFSAVIFYESNTFKPRVLEKAKAQANILAKILTPPLLFDDSNTVAKYLATFGYWQEIEAAAVYDKQGVFFSGYRQRDSTSSDFPEHAPKLGAAFKAEGLAYSVPMPWEKSVIGTVWLEQRLPPLYARLPQYGIMFSVVMLSLIAVAVMLGLALKYSVSFPITSLAGIVRSLIQKQDYSLRAPTLGHDEIGDLTDAFNQMLGKIGQRERALRESEERFSKAFHESPTPMSILQRDDGKILDINESNLRMLGYARAEVLGHESIELGMIDASQRELIRKLMEEQGVIRNLELKVGTKFRAKLDALVSVVQIDLGGVSCLLATSNDITDRKRVEDQLRQSQKMDAIGRLAGGIAHDFNNLLTAINGYSGMALQQMDAGHPMFEFMSEINKAGERAASLTKQLLAYSRKQVLQPGIWDLNLIVKDMAPMLKRLIGEDIDLVTKLEAGSQTIKVDRGQIEQIILNLSVNARDAMPKGGRLVFETKGSVSDPGNLNRYLEPAPGPFVMLSVMDTGTGMPPEVQAKLFEPFFTTKEVGKGTGLGLSVVYGILKQSGGGIGVESEIGKGTTFRLYFPMAAERATSADSSGEGEKKESFRGDETILVVEDSESVRNFSRLALEALGYNVLTAENGIEAISIIEKTEKIHLVISDVVMPGLGGTALAEQLRSRSPMIPVLLMSGYAEIPEKASTTTLAGIDMMKKPFTPEELAKRVRAVLEKNGKALRPGGIL